MSLSTLLLTIVIPIALVFHAVRTGRNSYWIFIILFIPGLGSVAYVVVEIIPGLFSGANAQSLGRSFKKALNPNKDLNEAKHAFDIAPTVVNRVRYARLLLDRQRWDDVIETLTPALTDFFAGDPAILEGLATAYYEKKDYPQALISIDKILENKEWPIKPHIELLRAGIYEVQKQPAEAEAIYGRLAKTAPGEGAKVAYGQFLVRQNRNLEAKAIFEDIIKRAKFMSAHAHKMEAENIGKARRELRGI